jgi:hypothetical protein
MAQGGGAIRRPFFRQTPYLTGSGQKEGTFARLFL